MKFPYRTPRKITTYSKTPTQITHTESQANPENVQFYVFTKVLEKDIHTYHFYQNLVNTSVVI